jgi:hypothetical protein
VHPNTVAERARVSVYDVLMHLNPTLPRLLRGPDALRGPGGNI